MQQQIPDLSRIVTTFTNDTSIFDYRKLGAGHIHDTYLITPQNHAPFVLQRLNTKVFPHPKQLIDTYLKVYKYLVQQPNFPLQLPKPIAATNGDYLLKNNTDDCWRAIDYLANTYAIERTETLAQVKQAAEAVGIFLRGLDGLNPAEIIPALPGFHDSLQRLKQFEQAIKKDLGGRLKIVQPEIDFVRTEAAVFYLIDQLKFPIRIVHGDPKIGNLLFDQKLHNVIAVLDWDTIMPGTIPADFGDLFRTMAATCPEDEVNLSKVGIDKKLFKALAVGFITPLQDWLTSLELDHLITGARWIILEQMMRFLTDYINGDIYYKVSYANHNLVRARNQMQLYKAVKAQEKELKEFIKSIAK